MREKRSLIESQLLGFLFAATFFASLLRAARNCLCVAGVGRQLALGASHRHRRFGVGLHLRKSAQLGERHPRPQETFAVGRFLEQFEGRGPAQVDPAAFAVGFGDDLGHGRRAMEVEVGVQALAMEPADRLGVLRIDVTNPALGSGLHETRVNGPAPTTPCYN